MFFSILSFIGGFIVGYMFRFIFEKLTRNKSELLTRKTAEEMVIFVILLTWVASMFVSFYQATYEVPIAVHALMGSIVGFLIKGDNPIANIVSRTTEVNSSQVTIEKK